MIDHPNGMWYNRYYLVLCECTKFKGNEGMQ